MKIIIVGSGKVGFTLAEQLALENHDIVIIDKNEDAVRHGTENLDVMGIQGNGASIRVLKEAGAGTADVLIAATNGDEMNMVCCLIAKKLGVSYTVARVRDIAYAQEYSLLKSELGINLIINPEHATAREISRVLRFPSAINVEHFARGKVEMVGFHANRDDAIIGVRLADLKKKIPKNVLFCAVVREDSVFIPNGETVLQENDLVYVIGDVQGITKFFKEIGRYMKNMKHVFIVGGGRIAYYLGTLLHDLDMNVKIVEQDEETCMALNENLPSAMIIHGDGTEPELLEAEYAKEADAFVALTGRDEENLLAAAYAKLQGVPMVIAKVNRRNYNAVLDSVGIHNVVSPKMVTVNNIMRFVRSIIACEGSVIQRLHRIVGGKAEAVEFLVEAETRYLGVPLKGLPLKDNILIAAIVRNGKVIIPEGDQTILVGDTVILVTANMSPVNLNDIFSDARGGTV